MIGYGTKAYMSKSLDSTLNLWKQFCEFQHKIVHSNAWIGKERLVASGKKVLPSWSTNVIKLEDRKGG